MVEDGAFSHKVDYVTILKGILNLEGHPNRITGSKVTAILLNVWILPIGGASSVKGLPLQPAQQACFLPSSMTGVICDIIGSPRRRGVIRVFVICHP